VTSIISSAICQDAYNNLSENPSSATSTESQPEAVSQPQTQTVVSGVTDENNTNSTPVA
jgi:hypothetical protein